MRTQKSKNNKGSLSVCLIVHIIGVHKQWKSTVAVPLPKSCTGVSSSVILLNKRFSGADLKQPHWLSSLKNPRALCSTSLQNLFNHVVICSSNREQRAQNPEAMTTSWAEIPFRDSHLQPVGTAPRNFSWLKLTGGVYSTLCTSDINAKGEDVHG